LTNQILIEHDADPLKTFLTLREQNPAPYGSYIKIGQREIVSSSPEQFLKVTTEGKISSKPIKGTRPRSLVPVEDELLAKELRENQKEQAENLMIVDLMRNDLGRVCEPGSVVVDKLFDVESYATVHQLVSTVSGTLQQGQNAVTALKACFPAGSMTGAPKIRAMEILEELEAGPRGPYSGAIGYLGFDGSADLGMTIRTLVFEGSLASLGVGGGITIDSSPDQELQETMLKADALLRTLGGNTWSH
jgi:anthranilate/para-aminobenzoate synthase component I